MTQAAPRTMVLLRHTLPDGSHHHDFMVQLNGPGSPLQTWRVADRIHELVIGEYGASFWAEPLGDHREAYLSFEGDLSEGRGAVKRIAEGLVHLPHPDTLLATDQAVFHATWHNGPNRRRLRFSGARDSAGGSRWLFSVVPA